MEKMILKNKCCFITGASGGIGQKIAIQLAKRGCNLFLIGRNSAKLKSLKKRIIEDIRNNAKVFYHTGDLNKISDIENIIKSAREKLGRIDVLINSAGIFPIKSLIDSTPGDFDECFNVNIKAPFIFCKEFSRDMIKHKWGRIVNIGSSSAYAGFKNTSIYCASKHALLGFSRSIYNELKKYNIRTFCISPGSVKTKMGKLVKNQDFNTFMKPEELAKYVIFLISFDHNMIQEEVRLSRFMR